MNFDGIPAVIFWGFRSKPKASNVSHLWFLWPAVSLCVCLCACVRSEWMPGRKRQRVCGILLSWHKRWYEVTSGVSHYEGMHCGRFQDMAADCVHSGRAVNAGLRKLTWIGFGEQCETVQVGERSTAGRWTRIRGTLGACRWSTVFLLGVAHNKELQSSFNLVSLISFQCLMFETKPKHTRFIL